MDDFDCVVIGTGPGGGEVAVRCARAGKRTAIVESRPLGGTCALRGCNPKSVLTHTAAAVDAVGQLAERSVGGTAAMHVDFPRLQSFKRSFTDPVPPSSAEKYRKAGIEVVRGAASFVGRSELEIGGRRIRGRNIVVATGSRPADLPFDGRQHVVTSDDYLELEQCPQRQVFIGGGYISAEFAFVSRIAGAEVTVVERTPQILKNFDPQLVELLTAKLKRMGLHIRTQCDVGSVKKRTDGSCDVAVRSMRENRVEHIAADLVIHGAGRVPNVDGLHLEAAGVDADEHGIRVDGQLRSVSNPAVFAIGDVAATEQPPLTPVANDHGSAVARLLLGDSAARPDSGPVPTVVFTRPHLCSVGLMEGAARKEIESLDIRFEDWSTRGSVRKAGESHAGCKLLIDKSNDRLVGAHLLAPGGAEIINALAIAMRWEITARQLKSTFFTFPTIFSELQGML